MKANNVFPPCRHRCHEGVHPTCCYWSPEPFSRAMTSIAVRDNNHRPYLRLQVASHAAWPAGSPVNRRAAEPPVLTCSRGCTQPRRRELPGASLWRLWDAGDRHWIGRVIGDTSTAAGGMQHTVCCIHARATHRADAARSSCRCCRWHRPRAARAPSCLWHKRGMMADVGDAWGQMPKSAFW